MSVGSAEAAGEEETRAGAHGNQAKGFWDLFTFIQKRQRGCRCSFHIYFPNCAYTLCLLSSMREVLHRTFKNHFTPNIRPQRGLGQAVPGSASVPQGGLRKPAGASLPGQAPGTQEGPRQGLGKRSPGDKLLYACPCPARVATAWPGCH